MKKNHVRTIAIMAIICLLLTGTVAAVPSDVTVSTVNTKGETLFKHTFDGVTNLNISANGNDVTVIAEHQNGRKQTVKVTEK